MEEHRETLLTLALANVHQYGWTEEAVVSAVEAANLPLSLSGVILSSSNNENADVSSDPGAALVYTFMDRSNAQLRQILFDSSIANSNPPLSSGEFKNEANLSEKVKERLYFALKTRLEMLTPYIRSKRWHEGMAIGALPQNALNTTQRLNDLVDCIEQDLNFVAGVNVTHNSMFSKAAIGGVYVACELHMLGDSHDNNVAQFDNTWSFLKQRIEELDALANVSDVNATSMFAVSTVAASMGSAVLSLGQPLARGAVSAMAGTILPQLMMMGQQVTANTNKASNVNSTVPKGGRPSDYEPRSSSTSSGSVRNFSTSDSSTNVKLLVDNAIESSDNDVVIFSKTYCPYCYAAKHLFAEQMPEIKVQVIELDEESDGDLMQAYLMERSGQRTVPNVFVKGNHLGGNDATQSAYKSGKLMELLKQGP